jgi:hypothetical protein
VGAAPVAAKAPRVEPLGRVLPDVNMPVTVFQDGLAPTCWLAAGPLAPGQVPNDAALASLRPRLGDPVSDQPGAPRFRALSREHAYRDPPRYRRQSELQGTGDIVPVFSAHLDPSAAAGPEGTGLFYAVLDSRRERVVAPRLGGEGLALWLSGLRTQTNHPVRLGPGLHGVLVRVDPEHFAEKAVESIAPVDVIRGLKEGRLAPCLPGSWRVAGPVPAELPPLEGEALARMPGTTLRVAEHDARVFAIPAVDHTALFTGLVDLPPGAPLAVEKQPAIRRIGTPQVVYAFAEINVPSDGILYVTCSADWYMRWHLDGRVIYDTLDRGNQTAATDVTAHPFAVAVTRGRHVLCVRVLPGSRGWSLTAAGGFADRPPAGLRVTPRFPPPPPELRIDPAFVEIPLPEARRTQWRRRLEAARGALEAVVRDLPDSTQAGRAQRLLEVLR